MEKEKLSGDVIVVKLTKKDHSEFKLLAVKNQTTMSEILRNHILAYIAASKPPKVVY